MYLCHGWWVTENQILLFRFNKYKDLEQQKTDMRNDHWPPPLVGEEAHDSNSNYIKLGFTAQ